MHTRKIIFLGLLCTFATMAGDWAQAKTIRAGVYPNAPMVHVSPQDEPSGIFIDLLNDFATKNHHKIEYISVTLQQGLQLLSEGKLQIMPAVAHSSERSLLYRFSKLPVIHSWAEVYSRADLQIMHLFDLKNRTVGGVLGNTHSLSLAAALEKLNIQACYKWYPDVDSSVKALRNHEVDAIALSKLYSVTRQLTGLTETAIVFNPVSIHFAFSPLDTQLNEEFDRYLGECKNSGKLDQTVYHWITPVKNVEIPRKVLWISILLLSGLMVLTALIIVMRMVIRKKTRQVRHVQHMNQLTMQKLRESEFQKTFILNSINDLVIFIGFDHKIGWANESEMLHRLQLDSSIVGKNCFQVFHGRTTPCPNCRYQERIRTGQHRIIEYFNEHIDRHISVSVHPAVDNNQIQHGYIKVIKDISLVMQSEKELEVARHKAKESDQLKSAFLANISHEIRTPMNAILGFTGLLDQPDLNANEKKEYIHIIQSNGNQLMQMLSDIVVFSQIESKQLPIQVKKVQLRKLLREVAAFAQLELNRQHKNHLEWKSDFAQIDENLLLLTDDKRLKQVLHNLIHNAIKFTNKGYIGLSVNKTRNTIQFQIKDTGIGVEPSQRELIFKRFVQANNNLSRQYGGTGLGLSISKEILLLLQSEIEIVSELGKGSVFGFELSTRH